MRRVIVLPSVSPHFSRALMDRVLLSILICLIMPFSTNAIILKGTILNSKNQRGVSGAYISLFNAKGLTRQITSDKKGHFIIEYVNPGKYDLDVTAIGFDDYLQEFILTSDSTITISLVKTPDISLNAITVTADKSEIVTRTANGEKFYLSSNAKKRRNPFRALEEIPVLISDATSTSLKTLDGKTPLILIDGNRIHSGISSINAEDIESVEVISQVSARYLQEGYSAIVNITVRKKKKNYIWLESAMTGDIPLSYFNGQLFGEVGNPRMSIYATVMSDIVHHEDANSTIHHTTHSYTQNYKAATRTNNLQLPCEVMLKLHPSESDYIATQFTGVMAKGNRHKNGCGTFSFAPYSTVSYSKNKSDMLAARAYWKHLSSDDTFELYGSYTYSNDDYNRNTADVYGADFVSRLAHYDYRGNLANLNADYEHKFSTGATIDAGVSLKFTHYKISDHIRQTQMRFDILNDYIYLSFNHRIRNILYMLSCGAEYIRIVTGSATNTYWRPRASFSSTWVANHSNALSIGYQIDNTAPSIDQLNPIDTSTDSLIVSTGNPYLKPQLTQRFNSKYTFSHKKFYISCGISYAIATNLFNPYGYLSDGIYYSTIHNSGHYSRLSTAISFSYRFNKGRVFWGYRLNNEFYQNQSVKNSFTTWVGGNIDINKWAINGNIEYTDRAYGEYLDIRYHSPASAVIRLIYNISPDIFIAISLNHFLGKYGTTRDMQSGGYCEKITTWFSEKNLRPSIQFRYTFRKNKNNKIDFDGIPQI